MGLVAERVVRGMRVRKGERGERRIVRGCMRGCVIGRGICGGRSGGLSGGLSGGRGRRGVVAGFGDAEDGVRGHARCFGAGGVAEDDVAQVLDGFDAHGGREEALAERVDALDGAGGVFEARVALDEVRELGDREIEVFGDDADGALGVDEVRECVVEVLIGEAGGMRRGVGRGALVRCGVRIGEDCVHGWSGVVGERCHVASVASLRSDSRMFGWSWAHVAKMCERSGRCVRGWPRVRARNVDMRTGRMRVCAGLRVQATGAAAGGRMRRWAEGMVWPHSGQAPEVFPARS